MTLNYNLKKLLAALLLLFICHAIGVAQLSIQEKLGYPKNAKLVIIHGDDLAVSHSENTATEEALEKGSVRSASIMVPCPWLPEIAAYARTHPMADLGLHLTLTSEWKYYKWGPVAGKSAVPGLVNQYGYFYSNTDSMYRNATAAEVETELRAQIEKAKNLGIDITHLDSHMGALFGRPEFTQVYLKLAREYEIPAMIGRPAPGTDAAKLLTDKDVVIDNFYSASPADFRKGMAAFYSESLHAVKPGLNIFIIHVAYDDKEMQAVTVDHPDWGAAWRQADHDFFTSDACRQLLKEEKIHVVTWREIRDKLYR